MSDGPYHLAGRNYRNGAKNNDYDVQESYRFGALELDSEFEAIYLLIGHASQTSARH